MVLATYGGDPIRLSIMYVTDWHVTSMSDRLNDDQRRIIVQASLWTMVIWAVALPLGILVFWLADLPSWLYITVGAMSAFGFGWSTLLVLVFRRRSRG